MPQGKGILTSSCKKFSSIWSRLVMLFLPHVISSCLKKSEDCKAILKIIIDSLVLLGLSTLLINNLRKHLIKHCLPHHLKQLAKNCDSRTESVFWRRNLQTNKANSTSKHWTSTAIFISVIKQP